ncbi:MAG: DUF2802 domain-containing protein [Agarilytica sp.]
MQGLDQLIEFFPLIGAILGLTVLTSVVLAHLFARSSVSTLRSAHDAEIQKLQTNVSVLTSGALGMGQKMLSLEVKYQRLKDAQEEIKQSDLEFSYTQAQKLISQGMDDSGVAANSGLSSTEINLMRMLQQGETTADLAQKPYAPAHHA